MLLRSLAEKIRISGYSCAVLRLASVEMESISEDIVTTALGHREESFEVKSYCSSHECQCRMIKLVKTPHHLHEWLTLGANKNSLCAFN